MDPRGDRTPQRAERDPRLLSRRTDVHEPVPTQAHRQPGRPGARARTPCGRHAAPHAERARPDLLRHRGDHWRRQFQQHGASLLQRRPGRGAALRAVRGGMRLHRTLLCGIRCARAGERKRVHLCLCELRRTVRLDHRLGAAHGVQHRQHLRGLQLERLLHEPARCLAPAPARVALDQLPERARRGARRHGRGGSHRVAHRPGDRGPAHHPGPACLRDQRLHHMAGVRGREGEPQREQCHGGAEAAGDRARDRRGPGPRGPGTLDPVPAERVRRGDGRRERRVLRLHRVRCSEHARRGKPRSATRPSAGHGLEPGDLHGGVHPPRAGAHRHGRFPKAGRERSAGRGVQDHRSEMDALHREHRSRGGHDQRDARVPIGATQDLDEHEPRWFAASTFRQHPSQVQDARLQHHRHRPGGGHSHLLHRRELHPGLHQHRHPLRLRVGMRWRARTAPARTHPRAIPPSVHQRQVPRTVDRVGGARADRAVRPAPFPPRARPHRLPP